MDINNKLNQLLDVKQDVMNILNSAEEIIIPESREHLFELAMGGSETGVFTVSYDGVNEASVIKCKNGVAVNYLDPYMRRREPECMVMADNLPTDKDTYQDRFGKDFDEVRTETYQWLSGQKLIVMPFIAGDPDIGYPSILIAPLNAGFFAGALADLQGFIPARQWTKAIKPRAIVYLAPPFRHTHFEGKQVVVHSRSENLHEIFSYNLYPGPSAKKGIYSVLLNIGEQEGWVTNHASTVKLTTVYDNILVLMHEGASGGGKSEMLEEIHREPNGRILLSQNLVTDEETFVDIKDNCDISPVTDDMALAHKDFVSDRGKLVVKDAESGWFLRVDHITEYGVSPRNEKLCTQPQQPLLFLNIQAVPGATCLIWEHVMDMPDKPCPNPRVVMPRHLIPDVINEPIEVDVRSFGVRTPPCTKENPSYGIIGMMHVLPISLAWLWRLVSPRGFANPSIIRSEGMEAEGVGSYWPFATGLRVDQANLLLEQMLNTPRTRYVLIPNQHIGAHKVGFKPQWLVREFLARWGSAKFRPDQIVESRCPLLGYSLKRLRLNDNFLPKGLLRTEHQPEVGVDAYDEGAKMLTDFFKEELQCFLTPDLDPRGREIIECFLNDGTIEDYVRLTPMQ